MEYTEELGKQAIAVLDWIARYVNEDGGYHLPDPARDYLAHPFGADEAPPEGRSVTITSDWGGTSLTVAVSERGHTHIGNDEAEYSAADVIEALHNLLVAEGPGLSWA